MEYNADSFVLEIELPIDIRNLRQEVNDLSRRVKVRLDNILKGLESNTNLKDYRNEIKDILCKYQEKQQAYEKIFESNRQILAGFRFNFRRIDINNHAAESMYLKLYSIIYNEMRKETNKYRDFLLEIEDPSRYTELHQHKPAMKAAKYALGNGSHLPSIKIQEYDDKPRHKTPRGTR